MFALIAGCGANHAIFRYGQEVQARAADKRLRALIEFDARQAVVTRLFLEKAQKP